MLGLNYLRSIKVATNWQITNRLKDCSKLNGGCEVCLSKKECQETYDKLFAEFSVYMTIERKEEREFRKLLKARNLVI